MPNSIFLKPIHLLANSVIGLSYSNGPPTISYQTNTSSRLGNPTDDFSCWSVFRTKSYWWPYDYKIPNPGSVFPVAALHDSNRFSSDYSLRDSWSSKADLPTVTYNEDACANMLGTASTLDQSKNEFNGTTASGGCVNGVNVACMWTISGEPPSCRISVRMQAALTLAVALLIKAGYMLIWNFRRRGQSRASSVKRMSR
jgi:hypothetical protein